MGYFPDSFDQIRRDLEQRHCEVISGERLRFINDSRRLDETTWKKIKDQLREHKIAAVRPSNLSKDVDILLYTINKESPIVKAAQLLKKFGPDGFEDNTDQMYRYSEFLRNIANADSNGSSPRRG